MIRRKPIRSSGRKGGINACAARVSPAGLVATGQGSAAPSDQLRATAAWLTAEPTTTCRGWRASKSRHAAVRPRDVCNFEQILWAAQQRMPTRRRRTNVMKRRYTCIMTALNAWAVALCCPHCGRTGTGTVSESSLDRPAKLHVSVDSLSIGFVAVELRSGVGQDIRCATCKSSALK